MSECKKQKLAGFEMPKEMAIVSQTWSVENDLLTAAMKMKRPQILKVCMADVDWCYARLK